MMKVMKALTIWQPWASLIMIGAFAHPTTTKKPPAAGRSRGGGHCAGD